MLSSQPSVLLADHQIRNAGPASTVRGDADPLAGSTEPGPSCFSPERLGSRLSVGITAHHQRCLCRPLAQATWSRWQEHWGGPTSGLWLQPCRVRAPGELRPLGSQAIQGGHVVHLCGLGERRDEWRRDEVIAPRRPRRRSLQLPERGMRCVQTIEPAHLATAMSAARPPLLPPLRSSARPI